MNITQDFQLESELVQYRASEPEPESGSASFEGWLTTKELSSLIRISTKTIRKLSREREIPYLQAGRERRYKLAKVEAALTRRSKNC